jgi:molecular chaperone GrpE
MGGKDNDSCQEAEEQKGDQIDSDIEKLAVADTDSPVESNETEEDEDDSSEEIEDVTASIELLSQKIEALQQAADENLNKALRASAELENMRKRTSRDIENAHKYALEKFVTELLPIIDSMELGITATDSADDIAGLREGMDLTLKMFSDTLEKFGIRIVDPQGEKFNPELHEAVSMQEYEDAEPGTVISVIQKGYELNGRLMRPAMVMVAK